MEQIGQWIVEELFGHWFVFVLVAVAGMGLKRWFLKDIDKQFQALRESQPSQHGRTDERIDKMAERFVERFERIELDTTRYNQSRFLERIEALERQVEELRNGGNHNI